MKKGLSLTCTVIAIVMVIANCGNSNESSDLKDLSEFFPEQFQNIDCFRSSEIRTFKGQSLYEYLDGGADIYHQYGFIDMATASYKAGDEELVLDIYRFDSDDDAFGLYSSYKPPGPGNMRLGVEGFSTGNSVDFVKGSYVVRIVGFDQEEATMTAIETIAEDLNSDIPGSSERPAMFGLFPVDNQVAGSEKMMAESFVGQIFLNDVYTMDYNIEGDEVTMFLSNDSTGEKYDDWVEQVEKEDFNPAGLPYDDQRVFLYNNDYYGNIVAGSIRGRLAGIIGYKENYREFLSRWLESLNNPDQE